MLQRSTPPPVNAKTAADEAPANAPTAADMRGFVYAGDFKIGDRLGDPQAVPSSSHGSGQRPSGAICVSAEHGAGHRPAMLFHAEERKEKAAQAIIRPDASDVEEREPGVGVEDDELSGLLAMIGEDVSGKAAGMRRQITARFGAAIQQARRTNPNLVAGLKVQMMAELASVAMCAEIERRGRQATIRRERGGRRLPRHRRPCEQRRACCTIKSLKDG